MKTKLLLTIVITSLFFIKQLSAQETNHLLRKCSICIHNTTHLSADAPYGAFTLREELPILIGTFGLSIVAQLVESPDALTMETIDLLDENDINKFDRYAVAQNSATANRASDIFAVGALALPALFLSHPSTREQLFPLAVMTGEVVLINYAITDIVKKISQRSRPLVYNPDVSLADKLDENTRRSFFSGHTSHTAALSFLVATVLDDYHPSAKKGMKIGLWTVAATIPAVTGYLRVRAGKHFPTDVISGYIAGGLVGVLIPHFHKKGRRDKKVSFMPTLGVGYASVQMRF